MLLTGDGDSGPWRLEVHTTHGGFDVCYDVVYSKRPQGGCNRLSSAVLFAGEDTNEGLIFGHVFGGSVGGTPVTKVRLQPLPTGAFEDVPVRSAEVSPLPTGVSLRFFAVKTSVAANHWEAFGMDDSGRVIEKANERPPPSH